MIKACKICDDIFVPITDSHTKTHGISLTEYKFLFEIDSNSECQFIPSDDRSDCCKLRVFEEAGNEYCIFHDSNENKNIVLFEEVLTIYLKIQIKTKNDMLFDKVHFPAPFKLENKIVENRLLFIDSTFYEGIELSKKLI